MAHHKRKRTREPKNRSSKCYCVPGIQRRDYWDNWPKASTRQRLRAELRREMDER